MSIPTCDVYHPLPKFGIASVFRVHGKATPTHTTPPNSYACLLALDHDIKRRDQCLRQPEREDEFGARHQQLGRETLEEGREPFLAGHVGQDAEPALGILEVAVLDSRFDHVQRRRHHQGR